MTRDERVDTRILEIKSVLRNEKKRRNTTRAALSNWSGVGGTTVFNVFSDDRRCSNLRTIMLVADALGYEVILRKREAAELLPDEAVKSPWSRDWGNR